MLSIRVKKIQKFEWLHPSFFFFEKSSFRNYLSTFRNWAMTFLLVIHSVPFLTSFTTHHSKWNWNLKFNENLSYMTGNEDLKKFMAKVFFFFLFFFLNRKYVLHFEIIIHHFFRWVSVWFVKHFGGKKL